MAFATSDGTSKGFGRSRPSALTRGVSCSSTDGHNLIIALERGKNDSDRDEEDEEDGGVGRTARVSATDIAECGTAGVTIIAPPLSAIRCEFTKQEATLATYLGAVAIRTSAQTLLNFIFCIGWTATRKLQLHTRF